MKKLKQPALFNFWDESTASVSDGCAGSCLDLALFSLDYSRFHFTRFSCACPLYAEMPCHDACRFPGGHLTIPTSLQDLQSLGQALFMYTDTHYASVVIAYISTYVLYAVPRAVLTVLTRFVE